MSFNATYPFDLPLLPPKIDFRSTELLELLIKARTELGELKGYSFSLPNPMLLISPAIIKESIASSNIENINTTIIDVLQNQLYPEIEQREPDKEVLRYRDAAIWGFEHLNSLSLSTRLITGIQKKLIPSSQGEYRKQQNKIENSSTKEVLYTPPISSNIPKLISNLEKFINYRPENIDPLIASAIAHYQFEAIHPFNDGNGRTGRILMVLQLIQEEVISLPILYISNYINKNRSDYYKLLRQVTTKDDWNSFILFMLSGFYLQAKETKEILFSIMKLFHSYKDEIKNKHKKIYSADLVEALFSFPIITPVKFGKELGVHYTTASRHLVALEKSGYLKENVVGKYHFYTNHKLLNIMKK